MNPRFVSACAVLVASLALVACAPERASDTYYRGQTMRAQTVELGVVEALRPVRIRGADTGIGTVGGAALGGVAGSAIGQGGGSVAGVIGGAILGGVLGNAIERDASTGNAVELTVRLDNGRLIAVTQQGAEPLRVGDRVRVISDGYTTRVVS